MKKKNIKQNTELFVSSLVAISSFIFFTSFVTTERTCVCTLMFSDMYVC